jgi:hypothetical protein
MEKIDRLGWAKGLALVSHGVRIGVRVNDPAALERLGDRLPPGWKPSPGPVVEELFSLVIGRNSPASNVRRYNLLYWGAGRVVRTLDPHEALEVLESFLNLVVAVRARRRVFVQAGVVGWQGKALVLPGRSGNGKSSLVAALVRAGAEYYSDQYAVLDAAGRVHPYPKPLTLQEDGGERPGKCPVDLLPGRFGTKPLPVGVVVFTHYRAGARWKPRQLSSGQAVLELLVNTVPARLRPEIALSTLERAVIRAVALKGRRGEASDIVQALLDRVASGTREELSGLTSQA